MDTEEAFNPIPSADAPTTARSAPPPGAVAEEEAGQPYIEVLADGLPFGAAMQRLKEGARIRRSSWPEGAFVQLVKGEAVRDAMRTIAPEVDGYKDNIAVAIPGMPLQDARFSSDDMLADDWQIKVQ